MAAQLIIASGHSSSRVLVKLASSVKERLVTKPMPFKSSAPLAEKEISSYLLRRTA
jgi:hypothetical protein